MDLERTLKESGGGGAHERLEAADVEHGDLMAISHVHRYELAAALCEGARVLDLGCGTGYGSRILARTATAVHGVDLAESAVNAAREGAGDAERDRLTFEQADAHAYLRSLAQERYDVVVCFEALEHVPDPDALLDELARLAEGGTRLILSIPNSRGFEEENEFHATDYGFEEMQAAAERLGGATIVEQHLAEASLLMPSPPAGELELRGRLAVPGAGEAPWANHWLLLVNADEGAVEGATARLGLAAGANHNAYMRQLEDANAELRRANARLGRQRLGLHDAAAASVLKRLEEHAERGEVARREADKWKQIADANDWHRRQLERQLAEPRYRVVDGVRERLLRAPGGEAVTRAAGALLKRSRA